MRTRIETSRLVLALFVGLSIASVMMATPVFASTTTTTTSASRPTTTYSCTVSIAYASGTFTVKTVVTATNGYLPGPSLTDYLQSYHSGTLYNTQSVKFSVGTNQASITMNVPVSSAGTGAYSFSSTILNSKGSQITACSGTYSL